MVRAVLALGRLVALLALVTCVGAALVGCNVASSEGAVRAPAAATAAPLPAATLAPSVTPTVTPLPTATVAPSATLMPSPAATLAAVYPPVAIDPGHGGNDLGARRWLNGRMADTEARVNLDLALRLRDRLEARGIPVRLTRDGDYALLEPRIDINNSGEADFVDEAQARVDAINATDAEVMISIHQNAFEWPDGSLAPDIGGTVVYYCADRPFADQSLRLAELVHEEVLLAFADLGHDVRDRGIWDDKVLREDGEPGSHLILLGPESPRIVRPVQMPGVLSETLFITHEVEGALAGDPAALDRFAEAYATAIQQYLDEHLAGR
jgi:N-acetylmuramoyl-L-alanine amidase